MGQTKVGAIKICAAKCGISVEDYSINVLSGLKWCWKCRTWRSLAEFGMCRSNYDGKDAKCLLCRRVAIRQNTKGRPGYFKGRVHSEESKDKMRASYRNIASRRVGKRHTLQTRKIISAITRVRTPRGSACHAFVDGRSSERGAHRLTAEYKRWRYDVYLRDQFTCQHCGDDRGGNLCAHHIKSFANYPDLRFVIGNGVTLCKSCHKIQHSDYLPKRT